MTTRVPVLAILLFLTADYAAAQIPERISYQGYLEQSGSPVDDPAATLTFRLYDVPTGGSALWTETQTGVAIESGVFSVLLGSVVSLNGVGFDGARYLSIAPGGGSASELSPRTFLASVPYSFSSRGLQLPFFGSAAAAFPASVFAIENTDTGTGIGVVSGWDGIRVEATGDGVHVIRAGNPSGGTTSSGLSNGFEVGATGGNGLWVGVADWDGVHVNIARDNGVGVYSAADDGVFVREAGTPSKNIAVPLAPNGFEVAGAEASGVMVGRADQSGVRIIESGMDGVLVEEAGSPSTSSYSLDHNGLEVRGAEGHGLYVGRADVDGVHVNSAGGLAGYFGGDVHVTGNLSVDGTSPGSSGWSLTGNAGTTPGTNFLGTTDNNALEIKVNARRTLRIEPPGVEGATNIIGGYSGNFLTAGVHGATIAGGGSQDVANLVSGNFGFVGGGVGNQAGASAAVAGGNENAASAFLSAVGGGGQNSAPGRWSVVPGGSDNTAGGDYSFAAGRHAYVRTAAEAGDTDGDQGTFVWADASSASNFMSSAANQFLVRATGGVGIGTTTPGAQLEVREGGSSRTALKVWSNVSGGIPGATFEAHNASTGSGIAASFTTDGTDATVIVQQNGSGPLIKGYASGKKFQVDGAGILYASGKVGVGTESPTARLHVAGTGGSAGYFGGDVEVTGDVTVGGTINNPSDGRLKQNIRPISYGLAEVMLLRPVEYEWIDRPGDGAHLGLVAQEVEDVISEIVVAPSTNDDAYRMRYAELIPIFIKAIQEQQAEIEALRDEIELIKTGRDSP